MTTDIIISNNILLLKCETEQSVFSCSVDSEGAFGAIPFGVLFHSLQFLFRDFTLENKLTAQMLLPNKCIYSNVASRGVVCGLWLTIDV